MHIIPEDLPRGDEVQRANYTQPPSSPEALILNLTLFQRGLTQLLIEKGVTNPSVQRIDLYANLHAPLRRFR